MAKKTIEEKLGELVQLGRYSDDGHMLAADILSELVLTNREVAGKIFAALPMLPIEAGTLIDHLSVLSGTLERQDMIVRHLARGDDARQMLVPPPKAKARRR